MSRFRCLPILLVALLIGCGHGLPPDTVRGGTRAPWNGGDVMVIGDSGAQAAAVREKLFHFVLADNGIINFVGHSQNEAATIDGVPFPPNHEGFAGRTVAEVSAILPTCLTRYAPRVTIIIDGVNDMFPRGTMETIEAVNAAKAAQVDAALAAMPSTRLILVTPVPANHPGQIWLDLWTSFINNLRAIETAKRAQGYDVRVADVYSAMLKNGVYWDGWYMGDQSHLTSDEQAITAGPYATGGMGGMTRMARAIYQATFADDPGIPTGTPAPEPSETLPVGPPLP